MTEQCHLYRGTRVLVITSALWLMLLFPISPAVAADWAGDEFLTGYVASILERDLYWERDSYRLKVAGGDATRGQFYNNKVDYYGMGVSLVF